ncbi:MAG: hypothetical protein V2I67_10710 [Thermoanaerobaculales bacterium]|jgi:hypothetical protein|nr:hypothetical protein [Thermoanaerobaculales bacterium]
MVPSQAFTKVLTEPDPDSLWELRGDLLEGGVAQDSPLMTLVREFGLFLDRFATATSSRDLNQLASKLDMSAIGGVVLENLFEGRKAKALALRLLTGGISEGLMVLASRQYVRAQEGELSALFRETAWILDRELWRWSLEVNPGLGGGERRKLIDGLLAPLFDGSPNNPVKAVIVGRIFQVLLLGHAGDVVSEGRS